MSNTKETWEEVLKQLEGLGLKLKFHLESELADDDDDDERAAEEAAKEVIVDAGGAVDAPATEAPRNEIATLIDGVEKFVDMIDDAFDALGKASKDEAVRSDLRDIGESLRNALAATWNDAGADLRDVLARPKRSDASDDAASAVGEIIDPDAPLPGDVSDS